MRRKRSGRRTARTGDGARPWRKVLFKVSGPGTRRGAPADAKIDLIDVSEAWIFGHAERGACGGTFSNVPNAATRKGHRPGSKAATDRHVGKRAATLMRRTLAALTLRRRAF